MLTAVVLGFYNQVIHNGFVNYDDNGYITDNPHVQAGLTWATVKWAFNTYAQANWHPLTWLSHALDFRLFGLNPPDITTGMYCFTRPTLSSFSCCCRA